MTTDAGPVLRPHAEEEYADELEALAKADAHPRPPHWQLSPWAVVTYLLGGTLDDGTTITPKYIGPRRVVEVAVATLATDRALLLLGLARDGQDVDERAPGGGHLRRLDAARPGDGGHAGGVAALRLELRPAAHRGAERAGAGAEPRPAGDAVRRRSCGWRS